MSEPSSHLERLRLERDRFIAFAFAAADVLLELDSKQRGNWGQYIVFGYLGRRLKLYDD